MSDHCIAEHMLQTKKETIHASCKSKLNLLLSLSSSLMIMFITIHEAHLLKTVSKNKTPPYRSVFSCHDNWSLSLSIRRQMMTENCSNQPKYLPRYMKIDKSCAFSYHLVLSIMFNKLTAKTAKCQIYYNITWIIFHANDCFKEKIDSSKELTQIRGILVAIVANTPNSQKSSYGTKGDDSKPYVLLGSRHIIMALDKHLCYK